MAQERREAKERLRAGILPPSSLGRPTRPETDGDLPSQAEEGEEAGEDEPCGVGAIA
jgi:hypothetical protein